VRHITSKSMSDASFIVANVTDVTRGLAHT
jgi:hypothetical protein